MSDSGNLSHEAMKAAAFGCITTIFIAGVIFGGSLVAIGMWVK